MLNSYIPDLEIEERLRDARMHLAIANRIQRRHERERSTLKKAKVINIRKRSISDELQKFLQPREDSHIP